MHQVLSKGIVLDRVIGGPSPWYCMSLLSIKLGLPLVLLATTDGSCDMIALFACLHHDLNPVSHASNNRYAR